MLTFLHGLLPDAFPAISEIPISVALLIICLEFYAFVIGPALWKWRYRQ